MAANVLLVLIAGPGSGKTHLCLAEVAAGRWGERVSFDFGRAMFGRGEHDQDATPAAVAWAYGRAAELLRAGCDVTVDATSTTAWERANWLAIAAAHGVPAVAVILRTSVDVARPRNDAREHPVPEPDFTEMHERVASLTAEMLLSEGFAEVVELRTSTTDEHATIVTPQEAP